MFFNNLIKNINSSKTIHTGGSIFGMILLYHSIKYKSIIYLITGILWLSANLILYKYEDKVYNILNNKLLFTILFMFIPAFVMGYFVLYETFKYNNNFLKILVLIVIIIDIIHLYQSIPKFALIILIVLLIIRFFNKSHYDDLHPELPFNKEYLDKSDILFIIPNYNNIPITNYPEYIEKLKSYAQKNNKQIGLHGYIHKPEGFFTKAEYGYELPESYIKDNIDLFRKAFNFEPKLFKAPCYNLHPKNREILLKLGLQISDINTLFLNKLFHNDNNIILTIFNKLNLLI